MGSRVALLGIYHESNTFASPATTGADFRAGKYLIGQAIREEYQAAHHEIGGMLEVMDREGIEVLPVVYASATPGGTISAETADWLVSTLLNELERVLPVDGCLVVPHGAAVSEEFRDLDGHWLSEVRRRVGKSIPIVGTLDLHANVSQRMVAATTALVTYRENPHLDMRQRGVEAANLMVGCLRKRIDPVQVLVQAPLAISIEQQLTGAEPCRGLSAFADQFREDPAILSLSIQLGFPYADVEEMGASVIVVANGDRAKALETARRVEGYLLDHRESFVGEKTGIEAALQQIATAARPVLLLDMGDNVGGGGPANNLALLQALEESGAYQYFVCICDPEAVRTAERHRPGETFELSIAGTVGEAPATCRIEATLLRLTDGEFEESHPRHGGEIRFQMGRTAVVSTARGSVLMLTSRRVMPFSLQQLISHGIDPTQFDAIVAKGVNAPIAAYAPVCPTLIQVDTPGVTQADMTRFAYQHRRRPLFPFER